MADFAAIELKAAREATGSFKGKGEIVFFLKRQVLGVKIFNLMAAEAFFKGGDTGKLDFLFKKLYLEFGYGKYEFSFSSNVISKVIEYIILARNFDEIAIYDRLSANNLQYVDMDIHDLTSFIEEGITLGQLSHGVKQVTEVEATEAAN